VYAMVLESDEEWDEYADDDENKDDYEDDTEE